MRRSPPSWCRRRSIWRIRLSSIVVWSRSTRISRWWLRWDMKKMIPLWFRKLRKCFRSLRRIWRSCAWKRCCPENMTSTMPFSAWMPEPEERSPVTGAVCCTGCTAGGQTRWALKQRFWIIWMEMRRESNPLQFRLTGRMPLAIWSQSAAYTVWSGFPPLMRQENGRPPLCPAMLCRILRKIWMWRSIRMICGLIPIVPAEPAVSILTRPLRLSGLPIFLQELWYSARMNVPSSRTRIRQCRCWKQSCIC